MNKDWRKDVPHRFLCYYLGFHPAGVSYLLKADSQNSNGTSGVYYRYVDKMQI